MTTPRAPWRAAADPPARTRGLTRRQRELAVSVFSPVAVLVLWELAVRTGLLDARFFPAPTAIVGTFAATTASGEL